MSQTTQRQTSLVGAIALILIGAAALAIPQLPSGSLRVLLPLVLGGILLGWGIVARNGGLMTLGSILSGFGLGLFLAGVPFQNQSSSVRGSVFWLSVGTGFLLIPLLAAQIARQSQRWAFVPGILLAGLGIAMFFGTTFADIVKLHVQFSVWLNNWWPVLLIATGVLLVVRSQLKKR